MKNINLISALCAMLSIASALPMKRPADQDVYPNGVKTRSMTLQKSPTNANTLDTKSIAQSTPMLSESTEIITWSDVVVQKQEKDIDVITPKKSDSAPDLLNAATYNAILDHFDSKQDISYLFRTNHENKENLMLEMHEWIEEMPEPARENYQATATLEFSSKKVVLELTALLEVPTASMVNKYQCLYCPKSFHNNSTLITHTRTHTNEKIVSCQYCNMPFGSQGNLNKHIYNIHTNPKSSTCTLCKRSFAQASYLPRHIKRCHSQRPDFARNR